jgi:benzoylformate decarboxylase
MPMESITPLDQAGARRGADVLLEVLRSEGVEYIFGNRGTTELPLMDALLATPVNRPRSGTLFEIAPIH